MHSLEQIHKNNAAATERFLANAGGKHVVAHYSGLNIVSHTEHDNLSDAKKAIEEVAENGIPGARSELVQAD